MASIVDGDEPGNPGTTSERHTNMRRTMLCFLALALVAAACAGEPTTVASQPPSTTAPGPAGATTATTLPAAAVQIPACSTVPRIAAPDDWYRDTPVYVGNEMPVEAVRDWAATQPGFQTIWIDREHNGWITVVFDDSAVERQADLVRLFPDVGVVAVAVDWRLGALRNLQDRIGADLRQMLDSFSVGVLETQGVVSIGVGRLTEDQRVELAERYAGQPVCLSEPPPGSVPVPGPQPPSGTGWELLAAEKGVGRSYHTQLAWDAESLAALWRDAGLDDAVPTVDFQSKIVIWFGAVFGSGCDNLRLDDVIVAGNLVYAEIVLPDSPVSCNMDANPFAFVVTLDRALLPGGPFSIQLDADGPPGGVPEERTNVDADLSVPGSTVEPDQITQGVFEPRDRYLQSGDYIEPGFPPADPYRLFVHCGIEWLGELNDVMWFTDEPMPPEWQALVTDSETLDVSVMMSEGPAPTLRATAGGVTVVYRPTSESPPGCD